MSRAFTSTLVFASAATFILTSHLDVQAQAASSTNMAPSTALSSSDRQFIESAALAGTTEVELGQLAQQRAVDDQVKQFAARMVEDHGKNNEELKRIASGKSV